jgi:hypothetical protein
MVDTGDCVMFLSDVSLILMQVSDVLQQMSFNEWMMKNGKH